jgi:hypothetical protein
MTLIDVVGPFLILISTLILAMGVFCLVLLGLELMNYRK